MLASSATGGAEMQGSLGTMNYALNIGTAKEYRDLFVGSDGKLNEATYNALMTKALSSKDETVQKYAAVLADRRDSVTANEAGMLYAMLEAS
ncbi:MAG: hypothetical protein IIU58_03805, partial [Clostridia bacterium]|nr:hypothetical protein [Clostridia bacterium]